MLLIIIDYRLEPDINVIFHDENKANGVDAYAENAYKSQIAPSYNNSLPLTEIP